jgi:hypothetical protein
MNPSWTRQGGGAAYHDRQANSANSDSD